MSRCRRAFAILPALPPCAWPVFVPAEGCKLAALGNRFRLDSSLVSTRSVLHSHLQKACEFNSLPHRHASSNLVARCYQRAYVCTQRRRGSIWAQRCPVT